MRTKNSRVAERRILGAFGIICFVFMLLIIRLVYIQIIQADEYTQKQKDLITYSSSITASRGDIYDRNMNILAKDATCARIVVYPANIEYPEDIAGELSEALQMNYDDVYKMVTSDSSEVTIKRRVDYMTALELDKKYNSDTKSKQFLAVFEDKKRYYTDPEFAQYILGFTNVDHEGAYGVEAEYNSVLKGIDGVETVIKDANGREIESLTQTKVEAIQGSNLVLTIDSIMQYYVENIVYEAYLENKPKRVIVAVSDPDTGEILAYSVYPGYDLSDPWTVTEDFKKAMLSKTDNDLSDNQLEMWKNPLTSYIYEPGSTFKIITTTAALEENISSTSRYYNCAGYLTVGGVRIKCDVYPGRHGSQNLADAVSNSCNPAMMKIAMEMGPDIFYKYIYNYGFAMPTGIDLDGEESGILSVNQDVNLVDFVTLAFGQGLGVTPIQMLQALNTAVNGGELLVPRVAKYVVDSETNEVTTEFGREVIRRVISESTSATIRDIMHYTAGNNNTIGRYYKGMKIGGKTGTAQKFENGAYLSGKYVASFYGMIPYDDPELSVMVIVDEPSGTFTMGGSVAAPLGAKILKSCYEYLCSLDINETTSDSAEMSAKVLIPDLRGKELADAKELLDALGIKFEIQGSENGVITSQSPMLVEYTEGTEIKLVVSEDSNAPVEMPDLKGMSVSQASRLLDSIGLVCNVNGGGIVKSQSVKAGTPVERGSVIDVYFEYLE
ncbi:MAG: PASTA domain-containing protein [Anaerofustis stercorihominis]|nr:PASTA domain-containing protein [Anaerofustis stercorihominis]